MVERILDSFEQWMRMGGWVMWPLLVLSMTVLTLIFERSWFWIASGLAWRRYRYSDLARDLREGKAQRVRSDIAADRSVYGEMLRHTLDQGATGAAAEQAIEDQRHRMERFMSTLGTTITAAPMLGILGTVSGMMSAFNVLSHEVVTDPSRVAGGIAEALLATVTGLGIALIVLFPYNAFRVHIDRAMGRMETLAAAAQHPSHSQI